MKPFPENLPRWERREAARQRRQQIAGVVMLAATASGAITWGIRLSSPGVAGILLLALPLGLWLLLDCPARRSQRPEELAVFNMDKADIAAAVLLALGLVGWLACPALLEGQGRGSLPWEGWLVLVLWLFLWMALMAYLLVAFRNEVVFIAPDGCAECWNTLGRHRLVETRPTQARFWPLLGRCYLCDETGRVLYHLDRGMINVDPLLDWLQAQGVDKAGEMRQRIAFPWPKVQNVLDWDEADRTPAHRWIVWLRLVGWLPPVFCLAQWWLLVKGLAVLGLRPASLIACWLPLVFFAGYLVWPQIFVWERYPTKPRVRGRRQLLATPAWRRMHVNLGLTFLPVCCALLWAWVESMAFMVSRTERMAVLCVALGLLLAVLCWKRCPTEWKREGWTILILAAMLAFPMGYSLNLALTAPAYPDTGTVVAVQPPETENDSTTLTIQWRGQELDAILYEDPALLLQPEETVELCVRESPLGIPLVSVCLD